MRPPEDFNDRECDRLGLYPRRENDRKKSSIKDADYLYYFKVKYYFEEVKMPKHGKDCYFLNNWDLFVQGVEWVYEQLGMEVWRVGVTAGDIVIWEGTDVAKQLPVRGIQQKKTTAADCNLDNVLTLRTRGRLKRPRNDDSDLDDMRKTEADTTTEPPPEGLVRDWSAYYMSHIRPRLGGGGIMGSGNGFEDTIRIGDRLVASSKPAMKLVDNRPATPESPSTEVKPVEGGGCEAVAGNNNSNEGECAYFWTPGDDAGTIPDSGEDNGDSYVGAGTHYSDLNEGEGGYFWTPGDDAGTRSDSGEDDGDSSATDEDSGDESGGSRPPAKKRKISPGT